MVRILAAACVLAALAVATMMALSGSSDTGRSDAAPPAETARPLLIHYAQSFPSTQQVANHADWYRSLPFDGMVIGGRRVDPVFFIDPGTSYSEKAILSDVRRLPSDMGQVSHNFFALRMITSLDWSDDAQWQQIEKNLRNLVRALRESGKPWDGVFLDNEFYGDSTSPWDYGVSSDPWTYSDTEGATPGMKPAEARALVRERGRQIMAAIIEEWPEIVVFNSQGPWIAQPETTAMLESSGVPDNDVSFANELSAAFTIGMAEATWGTSARLVDGGRFYGLRTPEQFRAARDWMRHGFAEHASSGLDREHAASYTEHLSASFGVYDRDKNKADWPPLPPDQLALLTRLALQESDRYVWLYTEKYEWGRGASWKEPVPRSYLDAVTLARVTAQLVRTGSAPWTGPP